MLFVLSKIFWAVANPGNLLLLVLLAGGLAALAPWRGLRRIGRALVALATILMLALAVLPLGAWLLAPLEDRFPGPEPLPARVDGIVVLGGAIDLGVSVARGRAQLNTAADRLTAFAELARRYPEARLVFSGGSGLILDQVHKEASFAAEVLIRLGLEPGRVAFERESRNTHENALLARDLVRPVPGETWLLVTSAYHMPRAVGSFRSAGWPVIPYPVDYVTAGVGESPWGFGFEGGLARASLAAKEWLGLIAYRLLGWTEQLFPAPATGQSG